MKPGKKSNRKGNLQKQINRIRKELSPENKFVGTGSIGQKVANTGIVFELSAMNQGTNDNERVGNEVRCMAVSVKGEFRMNTSIQSSTVRIVIFSDNNTGGPVSMGDYLEQVGTAVAPYQPYNRNNLTRFKTHYSKLMTMNTGGNNTLPINVYKKLKHSLFYQGALASNGGRGRVFLGFVSGQAGITEPVVDYITRFTYTDA